MAYQIKSGDTLGAIAAANKTTVADILKANPNISDPNKISAGASLNLPGAAAPILSSTVSGGGGQAINTSMQTTTPAVIGAPTKSLIPGIGTVTTTPKVPAAIPIVNSSVGDNAAGLYERTGVKAPPEITTSPTKKTYTSPNGAILDEAGNIITPAPALPEVPQYGPKTDKTQQAILDTYNSLNQQIDEIGAKITASTAASPEEVQLQKDLAAKKEQLAAFDKTTLERLKAYEGQGRGASTGYVTLEQDKERTAAALDRLGFANEVQGMTDQLAIAQSARKDMNDVQKTQFDLVTKKLDTALGIYTKIAALDEADQNHARQFLLDTVSFAEGKTFAQLDPATQQAITNNVANSPITLDMVKTALSRGADKLNKSAGDTLLTPEQAKAYNVPYGTTQSDIYGRVAPKDNNAGPLGTLTPTDKNDITQAGLSSSDTNTQSFFLNTDSAFRDYYKRQVASGGTKASSITDLAATYDKWVADQKKNSATDWANIFGTSSTAQTI